MSRVSILVLLGLSVITLAQTDADTTKSSIVFRDPFTLRLHVDKDRFYEEHYDRKIPFVADNAVYLFAGENFGINLIVKDGEVGEVLYQPDPAKSDVRLRFWQEKKLKSGMMLVIENKTKKKLFLDALMTVPQSKGIHKTSILPVDAGLSNYESWPHPIVQLVLTNLRFSEKSTKP